MVVILKRDIKGTGKAGDIVKVSDGYARNMLIPKGWAIESSCRTPCRTLRRGFGEGEGKTGRRRSRKEDFCSGTCKENRRDRSLY